MKIICGWQQRTDTNFRSNIPERQLFNKFFWNLKNTNLQIYHVKWFQNIFEKFENLHQWIVRVHCEGSSYGASEENDLAVSTFYRNVLYGMIYVLKYNNVGSIKGYMLNIHYHHCHLHHLHHIYWLWFIVGILVAEHFPQIFSVWHQNETKHHPHLGDIINDHEPNQHNVDYHHHWEIFGALHIWC